MNAPAEPVSRLLRKTKAIDIRPNRSPPAQIRVMIVDDSLTVRTIFRRMVESDSAMQVSASASSAERAIAQLRKDPVDVVLLDLEMPGIGGLQALPEILQACDNVQVLVVSALTEDGAEATLKALSTGAADTMLKPRPGGFNEEYRSQLLAKIHALGNNRADIAEGTGDPGEAYNAPKFAVPSRALMSKARPEVIAIGASTGGIHALNLMLRELTPDLDLPILITQHLPASFIPVFARQVEAASARPTHIAEEGTPIRAGEIAIATGHGHLTVRRSGERLIAKTCTQPAHSGCLPSVDPMLTSLADACAGRVLAIILSGMGRDGLTGAEILAKAGGTIWAQDPQTSAVWGMPGAVTKAGLTRYTAAPEDLGKTVMAHLAKAEASGSTTEPS